MAEEENVDITESISDDEELASLFFSDSNDRKFDFHGTGQIKKEELAKFKKQVDDSPKKILPVYPVKPDPPKPKTKPVEPEKKSQPPKPLHKKPTKQNKLFEKQAKFLRKATEHLVNRKTKQLEQELQHEDMLRIRRELRQKRKKRPDFARNPRLKYAPINGDNCNHQDNFFSIDQAGNIVSKCAHCSRIKHWSIAEWNFYINKTKGHASVINPNPLMFQF